MSTNKSIAKSAGVIGFATLISRVLGFVRDVMFAAFFGTGLYAQAFVVAFRIPNLLRDLIGEGAANAAFVPVLVEELSQNGREAFWRLANILLNIILIILSVLAIAGFLLAKPMVIAIAPGFLADPAKFNVTVSLTQTIFPYIILIGLAAYGMGVLNSLKHFAAPAFGMCLLNISIIACMFMWQRDVLGLAVGVLIGGVLQVAILVIPLIRNGMVFNQRGFLHPGVKKILRLFIPRIFGSGVYHINVFISNILASLSGIVGEGAVAALWFSSRLWQLPFAVFANALAQAALPTLSGHMASNDTDKFKSAINFLLRSVCFLLLPASAGLIALSQPIVETLFQRGVFDAYSTQITSQALLFHTFGLLAYGVVRILVNGFYSMQDTKTPVKIAAASLLINISVSAIFMFPLKVGGLALGNSVSGIFNATLLYILLSRRIGSFGGKKFLVSFLRILGASLFMGIFTCWLMQYLQAVLISSSVLVGIMRLLITILCSIVFYMLLCYILRIEELKELKRWALKRR